MTVGSLFAGIGGFDLGFERAGYDIRWQVEIDPWARAVLAKHWPDVHRHDDIRTAGAHNLEPVDVIVGGWPCQPFTHFDGPEFETVVSDMEAIDYEVAPPLEVPACAFRHDHRRSRLWILGHANRDGQSGLPLYGAMARMSGGHCVAVRMGDAHGISGWVDGSAPTVDTGPDEYWYDRLRGLGNAVVPQIPEWIASHIRAVEAQRVAV